MSKKIKQTTFQIGFKNNATTTADLSVPEGYMLVEKEEHNKRLEEHKERLEDKLQIKELELQNAHNDEKVQLYKQIDDLQNKLANLPESLKKEQETNAKLVARLEQMEGKVAEKKFQKAVDACKETDFTKADKILIEIEENEQLTKKEFGDIAFARGEIAQIEVRWHDALEHYARAVQFDPCFENLIRAQKLALDVGDYDSALSLGLAAQEAAINEYGEYTEEYAKSLNNIGSVYSECKKNELAEPLYEEALKINQHIFGKKHPYVATGLNNLGRMYQIKNQHRKATHLLTRALNIHKDLLGLKHPLTACTLNNLGSSYKELGEIKEAETLFKKVLKIRKEILGLRHPATANSFNSLANLYRVQRKYTKADPYFKQAVEIIENALGSDHPDTKLFKQNYEINKKDLPRI